jgi:peptidoglycan hydrolase-like protein with peptidoglycan-binding domain
MKILELDNQASKELTKPLSVKNLISGVELSFGSTGPDVKLFQKALDSVGITPGPIDGKFGRQTKAATIVFQNSVNIEPDGIAGRDTFTELQKMLDGKKEKPAVPKADTVKPVKVKDLPNPNNAKAIYEKFLDAGFNEVQSAAWVGCISGESANNPNAIGPEVNRKTGERYNSYGLCQWNKGRFKNLQKYAKSKTGNPDGWKNNVDLQVDFVMWELDNWDSVMGNSTNPATSIKPHTDNLEKTLYNLIAHFEKPANKDLAFKQRLPYAKAALNHFGTTDLSQ